MVTAYAFLSSTLEGNVLWLSLIFIIADNDNMNNNISKIIL